MDGKSATQCDDLICHRETMKVEHRTLYLDQSHKLEVRPVSPDPHRVSHANCTALPMTISPKSITASTKHVRFSLPTNDTKDINNLRNIFDDVDCMMIDDDSMDPSIDDVCPNDMYWDRDDMKKNRLYAQQKAIIIRNKYPKEVEALESVIVECWHEENAMKQQIPTKPNLFSIIQTEVTTMHHWSSSYVRGLEDYMTPILSEKRCIARQHLLRYQEFLQEQQQSEIPEKLGEYSRRLSQPSRDFAVKLAIGDALAASCDP